MECDSFNWCWHNEYGRTLHHKLFVSVWDVASRKSKRTIVDVFVFWQTVKQNTLIYYSVDKNAIYLSVFGNRSLCHDFILKIPLFVSILHLKCVCVGASHKKGIPYQMTLSDFVTLAFIFIANLDCSILPFCFFH